MNIYVFGNPDLGSDAFPIRMLPDLRARLPYVNFIVQDPHELGIPEEEKYWVLDTVRGLKEVRIITLDEIKKTRARVTMHDFDLATHLLLVSKLKKNIKIKIIGDRKSTRLNSSHIPLSRMPSSA